MKKTLMFAACAAMVFSMVSCKNGNKRPLKPLPRSQPLLSTQ